MNGAIQNSDRPETFSKEELLDGENETATTLLEAVAWAVYKSMSKNPMVSSVDWFFLEYPRDKKLMKAIREDIRMHIRSLKKVPANGFGFKWIKFSYINSYISRSKEENFPLYFWDRTRDALNNSSEIQTTYEMDNQKYSTEPISTNAISENELAELGSTQSYPAPSVLESQLIAQVRAKDIVLMATNFWHEVIKRAQRSVPVFTKSFIGYLKTHYSCLGTRSRENLSYDEAYHQDSSKADNSVFPPPVDESRDKAFMGKAVEILSGCKDVWKMAFVLKWTMGPKEPTDVLLNDICDVTNAKNGYSKIVDRCNQAIQDLSEGWPMDETAYTHFASCVMKECLKSVKNDILTRFEELNLNKECLQW
ncbi:hypothetical protein [uncultured Pseudodesulfovibrio sp.]|uniref:hypothetical protein n=1 Tax=uncultured Pseudodesulfovibrio sp. TaxID=2035858 RepID=UPI0029C651BE|nr:hypothetical protein [uncultured Pseudodesulfovibrio sp.]